MLTAWNGVLTSNFDPSPAIARFFQKNDRRESMPNVETYRNREFVSKFI